MTGYKRITALGRQSLTDIAIQEYGAPEAVFIILEDNEGKFTDISNVPPAGMQIMIRTETPTLNANNKAIMEVYRAKKVKVATVEQSNMSTGEYVTVGYWANGYTE